MIDFGSEFKKAIQDREMSYEIKGLISADLDVYPLGTDTKVISTVFESIIRPVVYDIAEENGLQVQEARAQNYYPDFTLMTGENDPEKIAVDVKTTYRESDDQRVNFTLGSYTSYIRAGNETKNIEFPYSQYAEEWIVGFIYKRSPSDQAPAQVYDLDDLDQIHVPFEDVSLFVARKWKIAGDRAGSGNTTNIGSIAGVLDDFRNEAGPFRSKGEFLDYWRNYGRTAAQRTGRFSNIGEYRKWKAAKR